MISKLDEVLALIESASDGDYLSRLERGTNIALECAEYLRENGPALRALLAEHKALLRRVADAPVATSQQEHPLALSIAARKAGYFAGKRVRILAEPGEVG